MTIQNVPASVWRAIVYRETVTTLHNRFVQVFAAVVVTGGIAVAALSSRPDAVPFGLLLLFLYLVPLFGLLIGVSAADEERGERPFLWSQPIPRSTYLLGKTATLAGILSVVLLGAVATALSVGAAVQTLGLLWGLGVALVLVSVSAGITVGQYTTGRARGLMAALLIWFGAFAAYDAAALLGAAVGGLQNVPALWVSLLLLNPVDAVRLAGLFGLEQVPFSAPGGEAWVKLILDWLPAWVAVSTAAWTGGLLTLACRRLRRLEL